MGVILKNYIDENTILGIWEIKEGYKELIRKISLDAEDSATLDSYKHEKRKIEWLSVRALMNQITGRESKIVYDISRKPFLVSDNFHISISHSHNLTSVLASKNKRVGIDLEFMSHRIKDLGFKFINDEEQITDDPDKEKYHLYVHWCAKEALYKICDKQDINFKDNLTIKPFNLQDRGQVEGRVHNIHGTEYFLLQYFRIDEYSVVWCTK
jgi:4'-phosphopantetheinyl transferase